METLKVLGIGFFGVVFGVLIFQWTYKTRKTDMFLSTSLKGYCAGILSIIFAIIYVLYQFHILNW